MYSWVNWGVNGEKVVRVQTYQSRRHSFQMYHRFFGFVNVHSSLHILSYAIWTQYDNKYWQYHQLCASDRCNVCQRAWPNCVYMGPWTSNMTFNTVLAIAKPINKKIWSPRPRKLHAMKPYDNGQLIKWGHASLSHNEELWLQFKSVTLSAERNTARHSMKLKNMVRRLQNIQKRLGLVPWLRWVLGLGGYIELGLV